MIECISASRPRCPTNELFEQTAMTVLVLAVLMSLVIAQISRYREEDGHIIDNSTRTDSLFMYHKPVIMTVDNSDIGSLSMLRCQLPTSRSPRYRFLRKQDLPIGDDMKGAHLNLRAQYRKSKASSNPNGDTTATNVMPTTDIHVAQIHPEVEDAMYDNQSYYREDHVILCANKTEHTVSAWCWSIPRALVLRGEPAVPLQSG